MPAIFISYRRADSADVAQPLYDELVKAFGADNVFKDVDAIPLGADFRAEIERALVRADIMLALIGPDWLTARDEAGQRRLDNPADFVRIELEMGLRHDNVRVIPVLVKNARMPDAASLPPSLYPLAYRNAAALRPGADFVPDVQRLIHKLRSSGDGRRTRRWLLAALGVLIVAALAVVVPLIVNPPPVTPVSTTTGPPPSAVPSLTPPPSTPTLPARVLQPVPLQPDTLQLSDAAAAQGYGWFASDTGLVQVMDGRPTVIEATRGTAIEALGVDDAGLVVWFSRRNSGDVARYTPATGELEWFTPEYNNGAVVVAIQVGTDGTAWFGDVNGGLFRYSAAGGWDSLAATTLPPLERVYSLHLKDGVLPVLWVVGDKSGVMVARRWQEGNWTELSRQDICLNADCVLTGALEDTVGRTWIVHSAGLTLVGRDQRAQNMLRCTAGQSGLLSDAITDLDISPDGRTLWLVTKGELAALDITPPEMPPRCADWDWSSWQEFGFWTESPTLQYRLAVGSDVWVMQTGSSRLRRLG